MSRSVSCEQLAIPAAVATQLRRTRRDTTSVIVQWRCVSGVAPLAVGSRAVFAGVFLCAREPVNACRWLAASAGGPVASQRHSFSVSARAGARGCRLISAR
jgi:hypothetical protein